MISVNVKINSRLKRKLSDYTMTMVTRQMVDKVGEETLAKVHEYGEGGFSPSGGAPHWQGLVTVKGHYSGYLSDTHKLKYLTSNHVQIITTADFAEGVIIGQSTNWITRDGGYYVFTPNPYHKRAVDNALSNEKVGAIWKEVLKGKIT